MYSTASAHFTMTISALNMHATICSNPEKKLNDNFTVRFNAFVDELKHNKYDLTDFGRQGSRLLNTYFAFSQSCTDDVE